MTAAVDCLQSERFRPSTRGRQRPTRGADKEFASPMTQIALVLEAVLPAGRQGTLFADATRPRERGKGPVEEVAL